MCHHLYSEYDPEPVVWPSPQEARVMLARYRSLSEVARTTHMMNQDSFIMRRISKAQDKLFAIRREIKRKQLKLFMYQCIAGLATLDSFDMRDVEVMRSVIDEVLSECNARMEMLKGSGREDGAGPSSASPLVAPPVLGQMVGGAGPSFNGLWLLR